MLFRSEEVQPSVAGVQAMITVVSQGTIVDFPFLVKYQGVGGGEQKAAKEKGR